MRNETNEKLPKLHETDSRVKTPGPALGEVKMSFLSTLKKSREHVRAQQADPWHVRLEAVRGRVGDDAVERIATHTLFDILEIPQGRRTAGACRRLAKLMRDLGWSPIKARGLTPGGFKDQIRGYARAKNWSVML